MVKLLIVIYSFNFTKFFNSQSSENFVTRRFDDDFPFCSYKVLNESCFYLYQ